MNFALKLALNCYAGEFTLCITFTSIKNLGFPLHCKKTNLTENSLTGEELLSLVLID